MGRASWIPDPTLPVRIQSKNGKSNVSKKGPEILIGTPGRIFELIKLKKIKMMNVETIILDEFDQLLDDSQIHFVEKITHYAPRDHQLVYMSATTKFDQEKIAPNMHTIDLSDQKFGQYPAFLHASGTT